MRAVRLGASAVGALALTAGCSSGDAPKAWNQLSTCLAGKAAKEPLPVRVQAIRQVQLASAAPGASQAAWPARCAGYADELYAALPASGVGAVLKRKLGGRLGCSDEKGSCKLAGGSAVLGVTTELWDAAKDSGLSTTEVAAGVPLPDALPPPVLDAKSWKSLSAKPLKVAGPISTQDGRAFVVLKAAEGRARPTGCEFTDGFDKLSCFEANAKLPELPAHTQEAVTDPGAFVAGLNEAGLVAYDLRTGEESAVRGQGRNLIRDGVAVEPAAKDAPPAVDAGPGATPEAKDEGFIAVELKAGKVVREVKLPITNAVGKPISVGKHVAYLSHADSGADLNVITVANGRVVPEAKLKGGFSGAFHVCRNGDAVAVATFSSRSGLSSAKPTGGANKTQLSAALFRDGAWSKTLEATLPFDRASESELLCTPSGASLAWARSADGGVEIGRVDCSADGCKSNDVKLPGVESKWWWAVAPLGDKVLVLWRSDLGETRLRVAPLAELPSAKDSLVFDTPDFGGPNAGELSSVLGQDAALLIFGREQPVALRVGKDGAVRLLAP